jgi:perosamine synthetase
VSARDDFRHAIAGVVGVEPDHVSLFWKGRVALYAILRALGMGRGDEVLIPAFTCVAVPNAVLYAGATPVYADIDAATYTLSPEAAAAAMTPRTRAVLAQNTFGLSSDIDALRAVAERHGAALIDDSTHGLGGAHQGRPSGAAADAAFFSTQWSKPISTGLGGIAVTSDPALAADLRALERSAREPTRRDQTLLRAMVVARERLATPRTLAAGRAVYRTVSRAGVVPGSSSREELESTAMPDGFMTRMSPAQAALGTPRLRTLAEAVRHRRAVAGRWSAWLRAHGATAAHEPAGAAHTFLRYPLRVRERDAFLADARRRGLDLGDWFVSPLHPIEGDLTPWGYRGGTAPVAERVASEIVNLPTDVPLTGARADAVERLLDASRDRLL